METGCCAPRILARWHRLSSIMRTGVPAVAKCCVAALPRFDPAGFVHVAALPRVPFPPGTECRVLRGGQLNGSSKRRFDGFGRRGDLALASMSLAFQRLNSRQGQNETQIVDG